MASVRLNAGMREEILRIVMEKTDFEQQLKQLGDATVNAEKIYDFLYDKKTQKTLAEAPEGWFCEHDHIRANLGGMSAHFKFPKTGEPAVVEPDEDPDYVEEPRFKRRFLHKHCGSYRVVVPADNPMATSYIHMTQETNRINEEKGRFKRKVEATLKSVTTVNRLLEVWPELKQIIPPEVFEGEIIGLPAIITSDLNKHINFGQAA